MNDITHIPKTEMYKELSHCSPPVEQLYVRGARTDLLDDTYAHLRVGMIGTRNATPAGLYDTRRIAQVVSGFGGIVVSGMALGIDGAAHQGAVDVSGETIAVLGSGVDVLYPARHNRLAHEIEQRGCIISEYDCGSQAVPWHFPVRNRIIAALSHVLVVTEGTLKGGARITVDLALAMGKPVLALPGPRRNRASELPNEIIKDGAVCITDPADVIREIGYCGGDLGWEKTHQFTQELSGKDRRLIEILAHEPLTHFDLAHLVSAQPELISLKLRSLEQCGIVRRNRGKYEVL